jgi:hypothetical protein
MMAIEIGIGISLRFLGISLPFRWYTSSLLGYVESYSQGSVLFFGA